MDVEAEAKAEAESLLGAPVREAVRLAHGRVWGVTEGVWRVTADNGRRAVLKLLRDGGEGWRREPDVYAERAAVLRHMAAWADEARALAAAHL